MSGKRPVDQLKLAVFLVVHLIAAVGIFFVDRSLIWIAAGLFSYLVRMFAVSVGYHRYFAHRAFQLNRFWQSLLAVLGCTAFQRGPLWWASHHRLHHRYADREGDPHSPVERGYGWAHMGWLFSSHIDQTNEREVRDFAQYPELFWIERNSVLISGAFAVAVWMLGGWNAFYWVVILSTVAVWHATMSINSISHGWGYRRFETPDVSTNNPIIALLVWGEGWHNNHHRYLSSPSFGQVWWEIDPGYGMLKLLSWMGVVRFKKQNAVD